MIKSILKFFLGLCFQDLPYIVNRVFRHMDFRINRVRALTRKDHPQKPTDHIESE